MKVTLPIGPRADMPRDGQSRTGARRSVVDRWRRLPRLVRWGTPVLAILLIVSQIVRVAAPPQAAVAPQPTALSSARLVAHGIVAPVNQARVGTLSGGVLAVVDVSVGDNVTPQQEVARVRGPGGLEVLSAPFGGTVTGVLAHTGDTLLPGVTVVTVADLSRLQVETNDVDEFLIGRVRPGQSVNLQIEALDRRELTGRILTVALQPQATSGGDQHYPVTIDLGGALPELRPGMSVRITWPD